MASVPVHCDIIGDNVVLRGITASEDSEIPSKEADFLIPLGPGGDMGLTIVSLSLP